MEPLLTLYDLIFAIAIIICLLLMVAYYTYAERKVIGFMQLRRGPNRVGPLGLLQPIVDGVKLLLKEPLTPALSNKLLHKFAPVFSFAPSIAAWALMPLLPFYQMADLDIGLLMLLAITSLSVYGIIIAGWSSNSKYALLGALRSSAQVVSYEIAMGMTFVGVLLAAGSMNLRDIILAQTGSIFHWYWLPLFPLFIVYIICALAETNRAPFDMAEGESEIVAGFHVEYSAMGFALFFLAEYSTMILVSFLAVILFLGGWLSPFEGLGFFEEPHFIWLLLKASVFMFGFLWIRATFPRYRYDQIMSLGWKILIPITFFWVFVVIFAAWFHLPPWFL